MDMCVSTVKMLRELCLLLWERWEPLRGFCFLFYGCAAWGILFPRPGIKPVPPAMEAWSPNHGTARKSSVPGF